MDKETCLPLHHTHHYHHPTLCHHQPPSPCEACLAAGLAIRAQKVTHSVPRHQELLCGGQGGGGGGRADAKPMSAAVGAAGKTEHICRQHDQTALLLRHFHLLQHVHLSQRVTPCSCQPHDLVAGGCNFVLQCSTFMPPPYATPLTPLAQALTHVPAPTRAIRGGVCCPAANSCCGVTVGYIVISCPGSTSTDCGGAGTMSQYALAVAAAGGGKGGGMAQGGSGSEHGHVV